MELITTVYAQDAAPAGGGDQPGGGSMIGMFMPLIIIFGIFYLLIFRPQQKQQKRKREMLGALKRGDEIITNGGIYGKITDLTDIFVMLQIANNMTIKMDRSQVNTLQNVTQEMQKK